MHKRSVRKKSEPLGPWFIAMVVFLLAAGVILYFSIRTTKHKTGDGCLGDGDCKGGYLCAAGGCITLLSDEIPSMWHDGLNRQSGESEKSEEPWAPRPSYGIALIDASLCSGEYRENLKASKNGGVVTTEYAVTVIEVGANFVRTIKQAKSSSSMWLNRMSFNFDPLGDGEGEPLFCHSKNIDEISVKNLSAVISVQAALSQSSPANAPAESSVSMRNSLTFSGKKKNTEISFSLSPVRGTDKKESTVLAIPLGTEIMAMSGPAPFKQRLLTGYVAYYWKNSSKRGVVSVKMKLPSKVKKSLDLREVKP
ncbi:MAG: hypothetical protein JXR91_05260 [Deltaproteobacteria bacterium]|nr:hypothetical protein [Deltaproteobacteria bacterium]